MAADQNGCTIDARLARDLTRVALDLLAAGHPVEVIEVALLRTAALWAACGGDWSRLSCPTSTVH
jgi:hypothetical protein